MEAKPDEPHRVVYTWGTQTRARVFPSLESANTFAQTVKAVRVHPARENPDIPRQATTRFQNNRRTTDMCKCGRRTKLTSDPYCFDCSGGPDIIRRQTYND